MEMNGIAPWTNCKYNYLPFVYLLCTKMVILAKTNFVYNVFAEVLTINFAFIKLT